MELTRVRVPARQARAVRVAAGQFVRVSTPEGAQVGDLFAVSLENVAGHLGFGYLGGEDPGAEHHSGEDPGAGHFSGGSPDAGHVDAGHLGAGNLSLEHLSAAHTRGHTSRLFPALGESFVTDRRRPILTLTGDTSPGRHDMLIPACDPARYRLLGHEGWHASCAQNLTAALSDHGIENQPVPQPVNLFMDIPVTADGRIEWRSSPAAPGAAVTLRADLDCLVVVSACPQDLVDINAMRPGPLDIEVLDK